MTNVLGSGSSAEDGVEADVKPISSVEGVMPLMELLRYWRTEVEALAEGGFASGLGLVDADGFVAGLVDTLNIFPQDQTAVGGKVVGWNEISRTLEKVAEIEPGELARLLDPDMSLRPLADLMRDILMEDTGRGRPSPPLGRPPSRHAA